MHVSGAAGRKATLAILSNVAGAGLGYVALLLIGRYVAPAAYGAYLFAVSLTGFFALLSNLGLGAAHQRQIAQGVEPGRALGVLLRLRLAIGLALAVLAFALYAAWSWLNGSPFTDATTPLVLGLAVVLHTVAAGRQLLLDTWQGQQKVHRVEVMRQLDTAVALLLLANLALLVAHLQGRWEIVPRVGEFWAGRLDLQAPPSDAEAALLLGACYVLAKTVTALLAWLWFLADRITISGWDPALARALLRTAGPLAAMGALVLVLQYTDTLMLGYFWTSREVGLYGTAQKLAGLGLLGATAAGTVLFPRFAQLHAAGDAPAQAATFANAQRYLLMLVLPIAAGLLALPRETLHIAVGDAYLGAVAPLRWLAAWSIILVLEQPLASRLMAEGHGRLLVHSASLNAGSNVVLNAVFIPSWGLGLGAEGAALATFVSTAVSYLYLRGRSRTLYGIGWLDGHQVRLPLAGAALAGFWMLAQAWAGPVAFDRVWELAGWGVAGALLYAAALAVVGEVRRQDLAFLRRVAHPSALWNEARGR